MRVDLLLDMSLLFAGFSLLQGSLTVSFPGRQIVYKLCDAFGCIGVLGRRSFLLRGQLVSEDRRPGDGRRHARSMTLGALQET